MPLFVAYLKHPIPPTRRASVSHRPLESDQWRHGRSRMPPPQRPGQRRRLCHPVPTGPVSSSLSSLRRRVRPIPLVSRYLLQEGMGGPPFLSDSPQAGALPFFQRTSRSPFPPDLTPAGLRIPFLFPNSCRLTRGVQATQAGQAPNTASCPKRQEAPSSGQR